MKLEGKVAIVTGAGDGIGRAIALTLAKEGANIVIADINAEKADTVSNEIKSLGRQSLSIKCDVSDSAGVNQMVNKTVDIFNKIDILVNNAGISHKMTPSENLAETDWDAVMNVNLKGQFICSQAVGKQMIKQKMGKIVNIASIAGHKGVHGMLAYGVSKCGVLQLTRTLAVEWAKYNINVNAVSPGTVITPMHRKLEQENPELVRLRLKVIPLRRFNEPEDIANVVLFLSCPESDNITGQTITIDGGSDITHPATIAILMREN
jgi:NAD(P)-dependent dehydrogenase (short-subunit alcohol dehydrogenase family)